MNFWQGDILSRRDAQPDRSPRKSCVRSSLRSACLEQWFSALVAWSSSLLSSDLLGLGCGLGCFFFFKAPQVILIAVKIANHCFGQWVAIESLNRPGSWVEGSETCSLSFPSTGAHSLWSQKEPCLPQCLSCCLLPGAGQKSEGQHSAQLTCPSRGAMT